VGSNQTRNGKKIPTKKADGSGRHMEDKGKAKERPKNVQPAGTKKGSGQNISFHKDLRVIFPLYFQDAPWPKFCSN
jgi:hypothetical protein